MKITAYNERYNLDLSGATGVVAASASYGAVSLGSNTPLIESGSGSPGSGPQAAAWDHVHPEFSSGSSSYGSNSTRVSSVSAAGASGSNSRADHVHDGIGTITASSSNTLRRGTVNLRPGSNVTFALSSSDGDAEVDTLTIAAAGSGSGSGGVTVSDEGTPLTTTATTLDFTGAGVTASGTGATKTINIPGGGSPSISTVGYNTAGASNEAWLTRKVYLKKVSLTAGQIVLSIGAYLDQTADTGNSMGVAIFTDDSGDPKYVLAYNNGGDSQNLLMARASGGSRDPRWFESPLCFVVPSTGDYWISVWGIQASSRIYYDGSGTDRHFTVSFAGISDYGRFTPTTTTNKYSIRAQVLG